MTRGPWKKVCKQGIVERHLESQNAAQRMVWRLQSLERELMTWSDADFAELAEMTRRSGSQGSFYFARTFVQCGKCPRTHVAFLFQNFWRLLRRWANELTQTARDSGLDVRDVRDLETILLEIDLAMPGEGRICCLENLPNAFAMLRSMRDLGISELGPSRPLTKRRPLTLKQKRRERMSARKRSLIVALALYLRAAANDKAKEPVFARTTNSGYSPRGGATVAMEPKTCGRSELNCGASPARCATNALTPVELAERRERWSAFRMLQADAIRGGRRLSDEQACAACGIDRKEFNSLRATAKREKWVDPRDAARLEQAKGRSR